MTGAGVRGSITLLAMLAGLASVGASPVIDRCRSERDVVILLHGLGRSDRSMRKLDTALLEDEYEVINLSYPSRDEPIEELVLHIDRTLEECCLGRDRYVHFVTHSMGGILVRYYLKSRPPENLGRVVMLSPPNAGSELVEVMEKVPFMPKLFGPSSRQLGTDPDDLPAVLGGVDFKLGVIAGSRSFSPSSWLVPGEDDGVVSVERAQVEGMLDFIVVPRTHVFIMRDELVIEQTLLFLKRGMFDHEAGTPGDADDESGVDESAPEEPALDK